MRRVPCLVAGLALLFLAACARPVGGPGGDSQAATANPTFPGAPVILISIDTLRSDHLPVYGYRGVETPAIDGLREDGVLFTRAYSHSPLTLPSHLSMLTGMLPADHGVRNNLGFTFDGASHVTLPSLLAAEGYATGAAVSAYVLRAGTGLGAQFDFYDDDFLLGGEGPSGALERAGFATVESACRWIEQHRGDRFFFFLHLFEPHTPYEPPEPFSSRYSLAYDGEIATADAVVGEFLTYLRGAGLFDETLIVLLSDHGEGLGDHGEDEHGIFLYREAIQVPLIVKLPGATAAGSAVDEPARLIDLLPTLARLVGVNPSPGLPGRHLFGEVADDVSGRVSVAETWVPRIHFGWSELWSVIDTRYHYIAAPNPELYDLLDDPEERDNLFESRRDESARLASQLKPFIRGLQGPVVVDPDEADRLRALGYLGVAAAPSAGPPPDPKNRIGSLRLLRDADTLAADGRSDEAIAGLQTLLEVEPGLTAGWLKLARITHQRGRLSEAISAYETTITLAPSLTATCGAALASIHLKLGRYDEAEIWARRSIDAGSTAGRVLLGRLLLARRDLAAAEVEARLAMDDPLHRIDGAVLLAETLVGQNRLDEALKIINVADSELSRHRGEPVERLHMVHGDILGRLERYDDAEREFKAEIESFPTNLPAYTNLAVVYYVQKRTELARATLERMVLANPQPIAMLLAAHTCRQVGDDEAAGAWQQRIGARE